MSASSVSEPQMSLRKKVLLAIPVIGIGLVSYRLLTYAPVEIAPKLPISKAFPECPKAPTKAYTWHGVRFEYPKGWSIDLDDKEYRTAGASGVSIAPPRDNDFLSVFQSIYLSSNKNPGSIGKTVELAWSRPAGELVRPGESPYVDAGVVAETMQTLRISGAQALLMMSRETGPIIPKEHDAWNLLVSHPKAEYLIQAPALINPYVRDNGGKVQRNESIVGQNEEAACAYWTLVKSLSFP